MNADSLRTMALRSDSLQRPDRWLDVDIYGEVDLSATGWNQDDSGNIVFDVPGGGTSSIQFGYVPQYTGSVASSDAICPPGLTFDMTIGQAGQTIATLRPSDAEPGSASDLMGSAQAGSQSPEAIARIGAVLRAIAASL